MTSHSTHTLPPVTAVIPVYNLAAYLPDTIESVLSQSYQGPLSIIILDDGSTDSSFEIASNYANTYQSITAHTQPNQGRAKTRNHLLQLANTEFISWIDGDDIASPNWIEQQIGRLLDRSNCVAVSAQGYAMTGKRHAIGPIEHPHDHQTIHDRHLRGQANAFFQSCVTIRKSAVSAAGAYDERFPCAEDYSLWLRLAEIGELENLPSIHLYYRVHATSANWVSNIDQRNQGQQILNEERAKRGLAPIQPSDTVIPPAKKDDWNRRIFWINLALKSGNARSALEMLVVALRKHPTSLVLWLAAFASLIDTLISFGNRTKRFQSGRSAEPKKLPMFSIYRFGRFANHLRRRWMQKRVKGSTT